MVHLPQTGRDEFDALATAHLVCLLGFLAVGPNEGAARVVRPRPLSFRCPSVT